MSDDSTGRSDGDEVASHLEVILRDFLSAAQLAYEAAADAYVARLDRERVLLYTVDEKRKMLSGGALFALRAERDAYLGREPGDTKPPDLSHLELHRRGELGTVPAVRDFLVTFWGESRSQRVQHDALLFGDGDPVVAVIDAVWTKLRPRLDTKTDQSFGIPVVEELGNRMTYPQALLSATYGSSKLAGTLKNIEQGNLFFDNDLALTVLKDAYENALVGGRALRDLNSGEVRALHGVLRLFASGGDDGTTFRIGTVIQVPWVTYKKAAGIANESQKAGLAAMRDLEQLARHEVPLSFRGIPKGSTKTHVYATMAPMLERPGFVFDDMAVEEAWARRNRKKPWTGPQPVSVRITLPPEMRFILRGVHLTPDLLNRLEEGSRKVAGKGRGLQPADWHLFTEILNTNQPKAEAAGGRHWSYVDRERYLLEHHGQAKLKKRRSELTERYLVSCQVLKAGGIVERYELEVEGRTGVRDKFLLAQDVQVSADKNQLALPTGDDEA